MGGCISRLLITDTGDKLWMKLFKKPPEQVPLSPESRKLFTEALIFQHRPEIGRVIFISAPLRGSELASNWLGRIGSSLVKSPITLLKAGRDAIKLTTFRSGELRLKRIPNSVDTLAPTNRFVLAINTIPITPGIPYHTIMGERLNDPLQARLIGLPCLVAVVVLNYSQTRRRNFFLPVYDCGFPNYLRRIFSYKWRPKQAAGLLRGNS
jgi:hypothetical protein